MTYDLILLDMFNLFYRRSSHIEEKSTVSIANNMINYIETDCRSHLTSNGKIFLLFDPIPKNDLGMDSAFKNSTVRKNLLAKYKKDRKHDALLLSVIDVVRQYFAHRGPGIIEVENCKYEADDFVESIVKRHQDKKIAAVTTDEDWARFLSKNFEMINEGWDKPFTREDFKSKYDFYPTIASVTFWKALFGDPSDNITGAVIFKRRKSMEVLKLSAFKFIKFISEQGYTLEEVEDRMKGYTFSALHKMTDKNPEEQFFYDVHTIGFKLLVQEGIETNLKLVKTLCEDYSKYAVWKDEDITINNIIARSLGRPVEGEKRKFKFGGVKSR